MTELTAKTWRAHRNLLECLKGYERGRTREESRREAERNWLEQLKNDYASKQGGDLIPAHLSLDDRDPQIW